MHKPQAFPKNKPTDPTWTVAGGANTAMHPPPPTLHPPPTPGVTLLGLLAT